MTALSSAVSTPRCQAPDRHPSDYLSFREIQRQYRCVTAGTLAAWASTRRYGFHKIVTKVGRSSRVRRDRWEAFLDARTVGAPPFCTCGIPGCQGPQGLQALGCIMRQSIGADEEEARR